MSRVVCARARTFRKSTKFEKGTSDKAGRVGFMVFLLGALCYTICTIKAPPQALEGEPSWHKFYHIMAFTEASCPIPSRARTGGFKEFLFGALVIVTL